MKNRYSKTENPATDADSIDNNMCAHPLDFIGQRADKAVVTDIQGVEEYEQADGIVTTGVVKEVDHYTISCDECGGVGYYDDLGEVVCDGCGMVLSGDDRPVIQTEFGEDETAGGSRGLEKMGDKHEQSYFGHEPSI
jgi:hypothetical protein